MTRWVDDRDPHDGNDVAFMRRNWKPLLAMLAIWLTIMATATIVR